MNAPMTAMPSRTKPPAQAAPFSKLGGRMLVLDGMRGIAILAVMAFHFSLFSGIPTTGVLAEAWDLLGHAGWIGVDLFFVLSGFLITGILHDSKGKKAYIRTFYSRRVLRIIPLYNPALAVFFLVLPALFPSAGIVRANTDAQFWYWGYLANVQIALQGWGATSPFLDHFWSLAVEEQFYLFWPVLVFVLSPRAMLRFCAGVVVFSLILRVYLFSIGSGVAAFVLTPARMDPLAVGAGIAILMRDPDLRARLIRWAGSARVALVALLSCIFLWRGGLDKTDVITGTIGLSLLAALFGLVIVSALTAPPGTASTRLFSSSWLRFFGTYSYALYVLHQPIALLLTAASLPATLFRLVGSSFLAHLGYSAVATILSVAAALLSWNLLEKHFLKFKDRVSDRSRVAVAMQPVMSV